MHKSGFLKADYKIISTGKYFANKWYIINLEPIGCVFCIFHSRMIEKKKYSQLYGDRVGLLFLFYADIKNIVSIYVENY